MYVIVSDLKIGHYTNMCFLFPAIVCHHTNQSGQTLNPMHITSQWQDNWKSASVVNSSLVDDTTIWQPGFDLPRRNRLKINHFRTNPGDCASRHKKWGIVTSDKKVWQTSNNVSHRQQLPTDQAEG